jgi:hypothetical protein
MYIYQLVDITAVNYRWESGYQTATQGRASP